ncbi:MAG TPA: hypothetical protein VF541_20960 [Longimicrobium sp.]
MIQTSPRMQPQPTRTASPRPVPCGLDLHLGPFEAIPELNGWLGADWCLCSACSSTLTTWTALRQRAAA